jgi:hypothetical protein
MPTHIAGTLLLAKVCGGDGHGLAVCDVRVGIVIHETHYAVTCLLTVRVLVVVGLDRCSLLFLGAWHRRGKANAVRPA